MDGRNHAQGILFEDHLHDGGVSIQPVPHELGDGQNGPLHSCHPLKVIGLD